MEFIYSDGGRSKYFKTEGVGDCVVRAIAIATEKDYKEVYDKINELGKQETKAQISHHKRRKRSSSRNGVFKETWKKYLKELGWIHHSVCGIGKAITMHLTTQEVPDGILIVQLSRHLVCIKNKVLYDTYNSSVKEYYDEYDNLIRNDKRAIYGYWTKGE